MGLNLQQRSEDEAERLRGELSTYIEPLPPIEAVERALQEHEAKLIVLKGGRGGNKNGNSTNNNGEKEETTTNNQRGTIDAFMAKLLYDALYQFNKTYALFLQGKKIQLLRDHPETIGKFHRQLIIEKAGPVNVTEMEFWQRYVVKCDEYCLMKQIQRKEEIAIRKRVFAKYNRPMKKNDSSGLFVTAMNTTTNITPMAAATAALAAQSAISTNTGTPTPTPIQTQTQPKQEEQTESPREEKEQAEPQSIQNETVEATADGTTTTPVVDEDTNEKENEVVIDDDDIKVHAATEQEVKEEEGPPDDSNKVQVNKMEKVIVVDAESKPQTETAATTTDQPNVVADVPAATAPVAAPAPASSAASTSTSTLEVGAIQVPDVFQPGSVNNDNNNDNSSRNHISTQDGLSDVSVKDQANRLVSSNGVIAPTVTVLQEELPSDSVQDQTTNWTNMNNGTEMRTSTLESVPKERVPQMVQDQTANWMNINGAVMTSTLQSVPKERVPQMVQDSSSGGNTNEIPPYFANPEQYQAYIPRRASIENSNTMMNNTITTPDVTAGKRPTILPYELPKQGSVRHLLNTWSSSSLETQKTQLPTTTTTTRTKTPPPRRTLQQYPTSSFLTPQPKKM